MKTAQYILLPAFAAIWLSACVTDPNSPGLEYMPDMYRSPAIEAYVDYGQEPYEVGEEVARAQRNTPSSRKPAPGTIAFRGMDELAFALPYAYAQTPEDYERAGLELTSPLVTNQANIEAGQRVYEAMCTQCHGVEGKGDGALSVNGHIAGIPSYVDKLKDLPEGKMYHTLTWGKGLMGSHASQLSQRQRWEVIEYIKVLQQGGEMPEFDENGMPMAPSETPESEDEPAAAPAAPAGMEGMADNASY
jgi:mono/diheme cytochrome c family protein